jgi:hypothetical protein
VGQTALAVLNFVFGGFNALGVLGMVAVMALFNAAKDTISSDDQRKVAEAWEQIGMGVFYLILFLMAVTSFLLIASGVGYLKQKKVLGRGFGNAYGILSIVYAVMWGLLVSADAGGGFNIGTIISLVYPVLTLALLNGTFKHDFVR